MEEMETPLYEERGRCFVFPYYFKIYEDRIEAYFLSFWPYRHTTPISDIKNISIVERIPWRYGRGLRIRSGEKALYFAIHRGRSIEIERKSDSVYWRKIILSVKDPDKFMSIVKERI